MCRLLTLRTRLECPPSGAWEKSGTPSRVTARLSSEDNFLGREHRKRQGFAGGTYDRLGLFGGDAARELKGKFEDYVRARVDLYRMRHDFLLWHRMEDFSREQQHQLVGLKDGIWNAAVAACRKSDYQPACS